MKQNIIFGIVAAAVVIAAVVIGAAVLDGGKTENINQTAGPAAQNNTNTNMDQNAELKIEDVKVGTGPAAKTGDSVTVNYTGTFADGTKFDSSLNPGRTPFVFTLGGQVIQGWNEGVVGMQVGGTRKLIIPPALGYGAQDYNGIPGNSTLYFTIELLKIGA